MTLLGTDFRASLAPATAERRLRYFEQQLAGAEAEATRMEIAGIDEAYNSVSYAYRQMLEAQIRFAELQIAEAGRRPRDTLTEIERRYLQAYEDLQRDPVIVAMREAYQNSAGEQR